MPNVLSELFKRVSARISLGDPEDQQQFSGERFLSGYRDGSIELQHVHRYCFALQYVADATVLDIACGEGYGSDLMGQVATRVIGVDIDPSAINLARQRYTRDNLLFKTGSANEIPLADASVDVVVSFETLEHVRGQADFWREIKRVLRKDGILIISSPDRDAYNERLSEKNPYHVHELSVQEFQTEIASRFLWHHLFTQANAFGSLILPASGDSSSLSQISADATTGELDWKADRDLKHPFMLAIASDRFQEPVGGSLYKGTYPEDALPSMVGGIVERDQRIRQLLLTIEEMTTRDSERAQALDSLRQANDEIRIEAQRSAAIQQDLDAISAECKTVRAEKEEALLEARRLKESFAEQEKVIEALRMLIKNYRGMPATS